jgi:hypothetical protein
MKFCGVAKILLFSTRAASGTMYPAPWKFRVLTSIVRAMIGSLVVMFCGAAIPSAAEHLNCAGIKADRDRMACQSQRRRDYGKVLERRLLGEGFEASVFVEEAGDPGSGAYPRLIIWAVLAEGKVHEINQTAKVLEGARSVGYRMLVYVDKGEENNWYFDLTRPGSTFLDVVPWQQPPWKKPGTAVGK